MDVVKRPYVAAVSGVKNSGKTTFLEKLIPVLTARGYQVAVIKHDGHEFEADVEGRDTFRLKRSRGVWLRHFFRQPLYGCKG